MRGCFDTPSIAFLYTICNSSFLPFSEKFVQREFTCIGQRFIDNLYR